MRPGSAGSAFEDLALDPTLYVVPRHQLRPPGFDLIDAARDLRGPSGLHILFRFAVQARNQLCRHVGTFVGIQRKRVGTNENSRGHALGLAAARPETEAMMTNGEAPPESKGVTVQLLAALDLGLEIEGMAGRQLRMRRATPAVGVSVDIVRIP